MKKHYIFLFFAIVCFLPGVALAQSAATPIASCQDFQNMNKNLYGSFQLVKDIDCSGFLFTSIGTLSAYFRGTLSGMDNNGVVHKVANITINSAPSNTYYSNASIFGYIQGVSGQEPAVIHDIQFTNVNIQYSSGNYIALLANMTNGSTTIYGVSVQGILTQQNNNSSTWVAGAFGTIAGVNDFVSNVAVNVTIQGNGIGKAMGGFAYQNQGNISQSSANVHLNGATAPSAGFVVINYGSISDSFSTGSLNFGTNPYNPSDPDNVGAGFVEQNLGTITNSYTTVAITGSVAPAGLVAQNSGTVTGSFWDMDVCGATCKSVGGTAEHTAQMYQNSTYSGSNFINTWSQYPQLRTPAGVFLTLNLTGKGSATISSAAVNPGFDSALNCTYNGTTGKTSGVCSGYFSNKPAFLASSSVAGTTITWNVNTCSNTVLPSQSPCIKDMLSTSNQINWTIDVEPRAAAKQLPSGNTLSPTNKVNYV